MRYFVVLGLLVLAGFLVWPRMLRARAVRTLEGTIQEVNSRVPATAGGGSSVDVSAIMCVIEPLSAEAAAHFEAGDAPQGLEVLAAMFERSRDELSPSNLIAHMARVNLEAKALDVLESALDGGQVEVEPARERLAALMAEAGDVDVGRRALEAELGFAASIAGGSDSGALSAEEAGELDRTLRGLLLALDVEVGRPAPAPGDASRAAGYHRWRGLLDQWKDHRRRLEAMGRRLDPGD
jgi:hypothetical protein